MYKFIQENQKKLMAVFGVVLMIAFIVPTTFRNSGTDIRREEGQIGSTKVYRDEIRQAEAEWNLLQQHVAVNSQQPGNSQWRPVVDLLPQDVTIAMEPNSPQTYHPEMYFLLQYEARKMGLTPGYTEADQMLSDPRVGIATPDGRYVSINDVNDDTLKAQIRQGLADFLMVQQSFQRVASAVKISQPLVEHELAQRLQQIKVRVVDFDAKNYDDKVPAPTDEQLQKQFNAYSDILKTTGPTEANPFGFGYKYPNRVKFDSIEVPREAVRKAVQAQKDAYAWEVEANRYYIEHQAEFPTTKPASTQAFSLAPPTSGPAPTTRPFAEVHDEILKKLIDPQVDRLQAQIQSDLSVRMKQDYEQWLSQNGGTAPATAPASQPAPGSYASAEYLSELARAIQSKYQNRVTLTISSYRDEFRGTAAIKLLPGVGQLPQFAEYLTTAAEPFVPAAQKSQPGVMKLFAPSSAITNSITQDGYIVRVTAADPEHVPASLAEVRPQVEADWKRLTAFEMAKADAQKLLDAAQVAGLESAADGRKVIQTGEYPMDPSALIENYELPSASTAIFVRKTFDMVSSLVGKASTTRPSAPLTLVPMPPANKVAVAELIFVDSRLASIGQDVARLYIGEQMRQQYDQSLMSNWFDYNSLVQRVGYVSDTGKNGPRPAED